MRAIWKILLKSIHFSLFSVESELLIVSDLSEVISSTICSFIVTRSLLKSFQISPSSSFYIPEETLL